MADEHDHPEAQWAPDPSGRHAYRYWDGTQWTGHVVDTERPPIYPPRPHQEPPDAGGRVPPRRGATPAPTRPAAEARPMVEAPADHGIDGYGADGYADDGADGHAEGYADDDHGGYDGSRRAAFWKGVFVGAAVILVAGIAGVALNGGINSSNSSSTTATTEPATTLPPTTLPPTTTTTVNPGRPPQQVRVEVVNSSGATNAATNKAAELKALGYPTAGLADGPIRKGTAVQCKTGFDLEAVTLAKNVGAGTTVEPFPTPAPAGSTNADCVVVLGQ